MHAPYPSTSLSRPVRHWVGIAVALFVAIVATSGTEPAAATARSDAGRTAFLLANTEVATRNPQPVPSASASAATNGLVLAALVGIALFPYRFGSGR